MLPKDPRRSAVALAYSGGRGAPLVVAKGRALLADKIVATARDAGVVVHEYPELAQILEQVELGKEIPPSLYVAVAELLAWVKRLEEDRGGTGVTPSAVQSAAPPFPRDSLFEIRASRP